jgi:ribosome recycling factor
MQKAVAHLEEQLRGLRAGELSPGFVETYRVPLDGHSGTPLNRLAAVTRQGPRIVVRPFDRAHAALIAKALADGNLNAYLVDPTTVAVAVPPLSLEQREQMTRQVRSLGEASRVAVRQIRQEVRKTIAARGHVPERAIQADTDAAIAQIDRLIETKVKELSD